MSGMTVVYLKATQHVVAAAIHSAVPDLPLRSIGDVDLRLPVGQLDAAGLDPDVNVVVRPYGYRVQATTTTDGKSKYTVEQLAAVALQVGPTANQQIQISALPAATDQVLVVVQPTTAGGPPTVVEELEPNGATAVTTAATFAPGKWSVATFATGVVPQADEVTV
jgi:hypothetical protein